MKDRNAPASKLGSAEWVTIEPKDPWLMCGPDTSVRELWRAVEAMGATRTFHLVFLDKYGWYCEHGRECPAVAAVQAFIREVRAMEARTRRHMAKQRIAKQRRR